MIGKAQSADSQKPPLTRGVSRTFKRRLHPVTGHLIVKDERLVLSIYGR